MYNLEKEIHVLQQNNIFPILRTCGSSHQEKLLQRLAGSYTVFDLSMPNLRMQVEQNARQFISHLPEKAFLMNLQYAPDFLETLLEADIPLCGLLGSCNQSYYLENVLQAGVGKADLLDLPLTDALAAAFVPGGDYLRQLAAKPAEKDVLGSIIYGSWENTAAKAAYVRKVIQQDIMELTTVSDDMKFFRFLCAAAGLAGNVVNYAVLAASVGISAPTAKQWLQFLAGTGMIYFVRPVEQMAGKRLVKAPKLYFRDTGIAAYLLQIADISTLLPSLYYKNLYENYVMNILYESYLQQGMEPAFSFYRDSNNKEISLLLQYENMLYPVMFAQEAISVHKLQRLHALLLPYAESEGLKLGDVCSIVLKGKGALLEEGFWQINAAQL